MNERWRVLALMTGAQAGASVVQQALGALSPLLVVAFALTKAQLGVVFTALMLGSAVFTALAGVLTDRWGERRLLLGSGVIMTGALLAATAVPTYAWLVGSMALFGAGYAASTPAGGRAILAWFDRDRGLAMGIRQTGVPIGGTIGAIILPLIAHAAGLSAAFIVAAVLVSVPTIVAVAFYRELRGGSGPGEPLAAGAPARMRELARDPRLIGVVLTCTALVAVQLAMNAFITVTAVSVGTTAAVAALTLAVAQAAAACGRLWWGWASDRLFAGDRLVPLVIVCIVAAGACAVLATIGRGAVIELFIAAAVLGASGAGWNGLMAASLTEIGGPARAASALGIGLTVIFGVSAAAPVAFGALADHTSLHLAWAAAGALALVGTVPVLLLRRSASRMA